MSRIGLLGGSFNPAHNGHRRVSLAAKRALALDEVWWLVSPGNPLKPARRHGPDRRAAGVGEAGGTPCTDPADRDRTPARHALYRR